MKKRKITFTGVFIYKNDKKLELQDFEENISQMEYSTSDDKKVEKYLINYNKNYLEIIFGDGHIGPRIPYVYNFETKEEEENPRQKNQIEPKENYAVIDFSTSFLWISNSNKRGLILNFLKDKFKKSNFIAKEIYDEEKFKNSLKYLDNISISVVPNLLIDQNVLSKVMFEEINGYGASKATLRFDYNNTLNFDFIKDKIYNILNNKNSFKNIVISGRDDKNLGMLLNSDGFARKIEIEANIDDNEMFVQENVFEKLITKIEYEKSK